MPTGAMLGQGSRGRPSNGKPNAGSGSKSCWRGTALAGNNMPNGPKFSVRSLGVYRSGEGRQELLALYEEGVSRLPGKFDRRRVSTRFGDTSVLIGGPDGAPPIVVHHGGNFPNPLTLAWFAPLLQRFRVFAPDIPGTPGYSAPRDLNPRNGSLGQWALDLLDGLELDAVPHIGASFGAGIILHLAARAPERLTKMALVVPAGLVTPRLWPLVTELALPMIRYRLKPTRANLEAAVRTLHTDPPDDLLLNTHAAVFKHLRLARGLPRLVSAQEMEQVNAPVLVIAAELDPLFPAAKVLPRAREVLPNVVVRTLAGSSHFPSAQHRREMMEAILHFLDA